MTGTLQGKRIINTRAAHQASDLDRLLRERGAIPLPYPCIAIAPPEDTSALDRALHRLVAGEYDWLVLTSANTVLSLSQRLEALGLATADQPKLQIAAVGTSTAKAAATLLGVRVDLIPEAFTAEALAQLLNPAPGTRIFLPQSSLARPALADALHNAGAMVTVVDAYQTVMGSGGIDVPALLAQGEIDGVVFTSSSTVRNFLHRLEAEGGIRAHLSNVCIACIGPRTTQTARECGLAVSVSPRVHTLEQLVSSLESYMESR